MLIGSYEHTFDTKGRVFIPAKWRESLGDAVVAMLGILPDNTLRCLFCMSLTEWDAFSARLSALPVTDMAGQALRRRLYASAASCEIDKQGRILLPRNLRETTGIGENAMLVGVGNRFEIWSPEQFERHNEAIERDYGAFLTHLSEMGI